MTLEARMAQVALKQIMSRIRQIERQDDIRAEDTDELESLYQEAAALCIRIRIEKAEAMEAV